MTPMVNVFSFSPAAREIDAGNIKLFASEAARLAVKANALLPAVLRSVACVAK